MVQTGPSEEPPGISLMSSTAGPMPRFESCLVGGGGGAAVSFSFPFDEAAAVAAELSVFSDVAGAAVDGAGSVMTVLSSDSGA